MTIKKYALTLLLIFSVFLLYGRDTLINLIPYSTGEIKIPYDPNTQNNVNTWYCDTITFSSGTKITFMELNQMITRNYLAFGGMVFIDTVSSVHYKFNESLEKEYENWNPSNLCPGMFTNTINNPDVFWNDVEYYPDSLAPCDTFVRCIIENVDSVIFTQARCIYRTWWYIMDQTNHTNSMQDYNAILYVKTLNNIHMKIQIFKFKIVEIEGMNGMHTYPDTITLFWAVDSLGNGLFKHDPTSNKKNQIESQTERVFIANFKGIPYLHLSDMLDTDNGIKIDIYNLKGRKILQKHMEYLKPINLSQFHSGIYLVHIISGEKNIIRNFILSK